MRYRPGLSNLLRPALVCALLAACAGLLGSCDLATRTLLLRNESPGTFTASAESLAAIPVDLSAVPEFGELKEKIRSLEPGFVFEARNRGAALRIGLWLAPESLATPEAVRERGICVLDGIDLPESTTVQVEFESSRGRVPARAADALLTAARKGPVHLYPIPAGSPEGWRIEIQGFATVVLALADI